MNSLRIKAVPGGLTLSAAIAASLVLTGCATAPMSEYEREAQAQIIPKP